MLAGLLGAAALLHLFCGTAAAQFDLPPLPPPDQYGTLVLNRTSSDNGIAPVVFPHWIHRQKYTCRVCHYELDFNMKAGTSGISEPACRAGRFCGNCHNGTTNFGHMENCERCHNGDRGRTKSRFGKWAGKMPQARFGNKVDWSAALAAGLVQPAPSLAADYRPMTLERALVLKAEWPMVPPAVFPHKEHEQWLDCSNCHPDLFNIEKKTTKHFSMVLNLHGQFCGVCHLTVAFPYNDCKRCHPEMRNR